MIHTSRQSSRRRVFRHVWSLPGLQVVLRYPTSRRIVRASVRHSMRRILVAGRYGALGSGSGSPPRTRLGPVSEYGSPEADYAIGCSISRPRTPRHSPRAVRLRRNPFQVAPSGVDDQLPPVFVPPSDRDTRMSGTDCFASEQRESMQPISPIFTSPDHFETIPDFRDRPRRDGSNNSFTPNMKRVPCFRFPSAGYRAIQEESPSPLQSGRIFSLVILFSFLWTTSKRNP